MKGYLLRPEDSPAYIFNWILILLGIINFIISIRSINNKYIEVVLTVLFIYTVT